MNQGWKFKYMVAIMHGHEISYKRTNYKHCSYNIIFSYSPCSLAVIMWYMNNDLIGHDHSWLYPMYGHAGDWCTWSTCSPSGRFHSHIYLHLGCLPCLQFYCDITMTSYSLGVWCRLNRFVDTFSWQRDWRSLWVWWGRSSVMEESDLVAGERRKKTRHSLNWWVQPINYRLFKVR